MPTTCPACGKENPDGFAFCGFCTAPLAEVAAPAAEERKVVSVLFCDLVGFTAASEKADPEDVRARLRPYHALLRERIEAFGGTVEKFVGDAVMAVFGAPVAHEDDAERAVRAGLSILESLERLDDADPRPGLSVRVGINTGEALVALDARPEQGEGFVTGDVVNTASRIQAAAPVGGIAVGEATHRTTERVFEWQPLESVSLKGKSEPVALWRPLRARARFGADVIRELSTPLVGRELEALQLRTVFDRVAGERVVQLVTLVGEPGVGKSRLVAELFAYTDSLTDLVTWRQGRCPPYGDGITFWALGEIVKAHAGVLESDPPGEARAKLDLVLPEDDDAPWLRARLLPLLGIESGPPVGRDESFAAWRRFLEAIADSGPLVLAFEDVHWADEALLAFLEHLADWAQGVPLLLVCTARPELYERHPAWGAGLRNSTTLNLAPLSDADTSRLVSVLLEQAVLPVETQQLLIERAGGNPLYAEELVRMLRDGDALDEHGRLREGVDATFPDSLQALIAARLDTLPADRKSLLQDAAVIGKVFWSGAVAAMGGREAGDVERALHELARKELVRPFRQSSMAGEQELGFWHALVRDVAYAQVPRAQRAAKHASAVAWLEEKAGERVEDVAEVLAYHTGEAIALAEAAGDAALASELAPAAARYALLAGERAVGLDTAKALSLLTRALELTDEDDAAYPAALARWASAAFQTGDLAGAASAFERAVAGLREQGDVERAARALVELSVVRHYLGDPGQLALQQESVALLEARPGPELVAALEGLAGSHLVRDEMHEGREAAQRSIDLAAELGLDEPARALSFRGSARCNLGDPGGLDDLERARTLLTERGQGRDAGVAAYNRALLELEIKGVDAGLAAFDSAIAFTESRGITAMTAGTRAARANALVPAGRLREALAASAVVAPEIEAMGNAVVLSQLQAMTALACSETGDRDRAHELAEAALAGAQATGNPSVLGSVTPVAALVRLELGSRAEARRLLLAFDPAGLHGEAALQLPTLVRASLAVDEIELAERFVAAVDGVLPAREAVLAAARAAIAEARGEWSEAAALYRDAAGRLHELGGRLEQAYAVLGRGRCRAALGHPAAEATIRDARALFAGMGAMPRVEECDRLLARITRRSS